MTSKNNELTPAEALRALADGETLESSDHYEGVIENERLVIRYKETGGLYCVVPLKWRRRIPKRDVGADPRVGDVLIRGKERFVVIYIGEEYVLSKQCNVAIGEYPLVTRRADWREWFQMWNCVVERVEDKVKQ